MPQPANHIGQTLLPGIVCRAQCKKAVERFRCQRLFAYLVARQTIFQSKPRIGTQALLRVDICLGRLPNKILMVSGFRSQFFHSRLFLPNQEKLLHNPALEDHGNLAQLAAIFSLPPRQIVNTFLEILPY